MHSDKEIIQSWVDIYALIQNRWINMADNVLDSGPSSAKRPKLSSPALSGSASDGNGIVEYTFLLLFRP